MLFRKPRPSGVVSGAEPLSPVEKYVDSVERRVAIAPVQGPELQSAISRARRWSRVAAILARVLGIVAVGCVGLVAWTGAIGRSESVDSKLPKSPVAAQNSREGNPLDWVPDHTLKPVLAHSIRLNGVGGTENLLYGVGASLGLCAAYTGGVLSRWYRRLPSAYGDEVAYYRNAVEALNALNDPPDQCRRVVEEKAGLLVLVRSTDGKTDSALLDAIFDPPPPQTPKDHGPEL